MLPTKCQTLSAFCSVEHCLPSRCIGWVEHYKGYPGVKFYASKDITTTCLSYSAIPLIDRVTSVGDSLRKRKTVFTVGADHLSL